MITYTPPTLSPLKPVLVLKPLTLSIPSSFRSLPTPPPSTSFTGMEDLPRLPLTGAGRLLGSQLFRDLATLSILMGYLFLVWKM